MLDLNNPKVVFEAIMYCISNGYIIKDPEICNEEGWRYSSAEDDVRERLTELLDSGKIPVEDVISKFSDLYEFVKYHSIYDSFTEQALLENVEACETIIKSKKLCNLITPKILDVLYEKGNNVLEHTDHFPEFAYTLDYFLKYKPKRSVLNFNFFKAGIFDFEGVEDFFLENCDWISSTIIHHYIFTKNYSINFVDKMMNNKKVNKDTLYMLNSNYKELYTPNGDVLVSGYIYDKDTDQINYRSHSVVHKKFPLSIGFYELTILSPQCANILEIAKARDSNLGLTFTDSVKLLNDYTKEHVITTQYMNAFINAYTHNVTNVIYVIHNVECQRFLCSYLGRVFGKMENVDVLKVMTNLISKYTEFSYVHQLYSDLLTSVCKNKSIKIDLIEAINASPKFIEDCSNSAINTIIDCNNVKNLEAAIDILNDGKKDTKIIKRLLQMSVDTYNIYTKKLFEYYCMILNDVPSFIKYSTYIAEYYYMILNDFKDNAEIMKSMNNISHKFKYSDKKGHPDYIGFATGCGKSNRKIEISSDTICNFDHINMNADNLIISIGCFKGNKSSALYLVNQKYKDEPDILKSYIEKIDRCYYSALQYIMINYDDIFIDTEYGKVIKR